jgi:sporulation protein YlmC with PRC-barrel domain
MLKRIMTTTALITLFATGAIAQDTTTPAPEAPAMEAPAADAPAMDAPAMDAPAMDATTVDATTTTGILATGYTIVDEDNLASEIMGKQVYSSAAADAEHIGDVNNFVIGDNGQINAVIIGVGGFLGIGVKDVAVNFAELEWVTAEDGTERFVLPTTKEALEAAPTFETRDSAAPMDGTTPVDPMAPADGTMAPADGSMAPADPAVDPAAPATTTN